MHFYLRKHNVHVCLPEGFVHRKQTRDFLDDDFASQFDGSAAVVSSLSLGFPAAGFLNTVIITSRISHFLIKITYINNSYGLSE